MALTQQEKQRAQKVREYIEMRWSASIAQPGSLRADAYPLPYPFVTPSDSGVFNGIMFYWDSFLASRGLILCDRPQDARSTVENMLWLVNTLGFVPNYTQTDGMYRSQPPLLAWMVQQSYLAQPDEDFLARGYAAVKKEHAFWMHNRAATHGLNRYFHSAPREYLTEFSLAMQERLRITVPAEETESFGLHKLAEAESGWDFCPRFDARCADFAPVDLNSILYSMELLLARWAEKLVPAEAQGWRDAATARKEAMNRYLLDPETGVFYDYDFVNDRRSPVLSAASFLPLMVGLATPEQAAAAVQLALPLLQTEHGILTCAKQENMPLTYQWNWPNGWAPLQFFVHQGLLRFGYTAQAEQLRRGWILLLVEQLENTGRLWEKYNVLTGTLEVSDEYEMPVYLSWIAGSFLHFLDLENG